MKNRKRYQARKLRRARHKAKTRLITIFCILAILLCGVLVEFYCASKPIEITDTDYSLYPGETTTISANNYENTNLDWSTSDKTVAAVEQGKITAISPGTARITMSNESEEVAVTVTVQSFTPPQNVTAAKSTENSIKITWDSVEKAQFYIIYRSTEPDGDFTKINTTKETVYEDSDVTSIQPYYYKVTACSLVNDIKTESAESAVTAKVALNLETPVVTVNQIKITALNISWEPVENSVKYILYKAATKDGKYKQIKELTKTKYKDTGLTCGKTYYYKVRALAEDSAYDSVASKGVGGKASLPKPGNLKAEKTGAAEITVTWTKVSKAKNYRIYRATSLKGEYTKLGNVKGKSYVDNTVTTGKTYYYKVKSVYKKEKGNSPCETTEGVRMKLATPKNVYATCTSPSKSKITWSTVKNAGAYVVYHSTKKNSDYKKIAVTTKNQYNDSGLNLEKTYYYKVIAMKSKDITKYNSSYSEATAVKIKVSTPELSIISNSESIALSWTKSPGASKYLIYRKTKGGSYQKLAATTKLKYTDKDVKKGTIYYYKIRAAVIKNGKAYYSEYTPKQKFAFYAIDPSSPMVALTFDDGPSQYTGDILDCLEKYNGHATFFVVGSRISANKNQIKRAFNLGCQIGSHTNDHANLTSLSSSKIKSNLAKVDTAVKNITGEKTGVLRPPYGSYNKTVCAAANRPLILWNIDTLDWKTRNASQTYKSVMNNVKDGDIVLMHDIYSQTAAAATKIIADLTKKGYQLVTVDELAYYKTKTLKKGSAYFSIK